MSRHPNLPGAITAEAANTIGIGSRRRALFVIASASIAAGCTAPGPRAAAPLTEPPLTEQQIAAIIAAPDRTDTDRTNDRRRKPAAMLSFIGLAPGMIAFDVSAGGGYTSELLARAVGPRGRVYGQSRPPDPARPASARSAQALAERQQRMRQAGVAAAPIEAVARPFDDPVPATIAPASIDVVTLMFNYHDFGNPGIDRAAMNRALFRALKPGGVYVIADHSGRAGTGISEYNTLHRVEQAFVRREVEAAGFRFAAEADFLRNPADPRDRNVPEPPQPKDEFVMKFVRP